MPEYMVKKPSPPAFIPPIDKNVKIWRYMDFAKFVSILERKGLFFSRVDRLGDPFEGSYAASNEEERKRVYEQLDIPTKFIKEKRGGGITKIYKKWVMVNCWHMSKYESAAMWKLYARTEEAICIQSTYKRLRDCMPDIYIGTVQYIDYEHDRIPEENIYFPFMYKRKSFEHEQELRAVSLWRTTKPPKEGVWKEVDLGKLIEKIHIAPTAPHWFSEVAQNIVSIYGLEKAVVHSELDREPFY